MRLLIIVCCVLLISCKKNSSDEPQYPISYSATVQEDWNYRYMTHSIDSFVLDPSHRLAKYIRLYSDTAFNGGDTGSNRLTFHYNGNDSLPHSYTADYRDGPDLHILKYDNQRRIIMDSSTTLEYTAYFSYSGQEIIILQDVVDYVGYYIDTMLVKDGRIETSKQWYVNSIKDLHTFGFTYSTYANPIRFPGNIGVLLMKMSGIDLYSDRLYSQRTRDNQIELAPTWTTDQYGRVVSGEYTQIDYGMPYLLKTAYRYY